MAITTNRRSQLKWNTCLIIATCLLPVSAYHFQSVLPISTTKYTWSWTLRVCQLRCGVAGSLWPLPTGDIDLSRSIRRLSSGDAPASLAKIQPRRDCAGSSRPDVRRFLRSVEATLRQRLTAELPAKLRQRRGRRLGRRGRRVRETPSPDSNPAVIVEVCVGDDITLDWNTDEKYLLQAFPQGDSDTDAPFVVHLAAESIWGARNGIETLAQLVTWDDATSSLVIVDGFLVRDGPTYPHRGLLLDSTRNFLPIAKLRDIIIDMAQNKLNVLHWHLTDSQSFPYDAPSIPELAATGAYSKEQTYSSSAVRALIKFAWARGVRILPEVDAPAHAAAGWTWGPTAGLGALVVCAPPGRDAYPWPYRCIEPPCGQMNPANHNLFPLLSRLFADLLRDLKAGGAPASAFHMGGDEVHVGCWNTSSEITTFLRKELGRKSRNRSDFIALWGYFQSKATAALDNAAAAVAQDTEPVGGDENLEAGIEPDNALWENTAADLVAGGEVAAGEDGRGRGASTRSLEQPIPVILWTSELTSPSVIREYLNKDRYVIQTWLNSGDPIARSLVSMGYRIIVSTKNAWYLDHGYGNWKGNSTSGYPYHPWQTAYDNDPSQDLEDIEAASGERLVLGGEAALWGEQVDAAGLEAKLWPRAAAVAERLWSGKAAGKWQDARIRMVRHRDRMTRHGTPSEALQPEWCTQHEGACY